MLLVLPLLLWLPLAAPPPAAATPQPVKSGVAEPSAPTNEQEEDPQASEELEEMRALEEVALDPSAHPSAAVLRSVRRLGMGNPLKDRIEDGFEEDPLRDDTPPRELGPIADVLKFDVARVAGEYDIPVEMQPLVAQYVRFFQGPGRKWFCKWLSRSTRYIPVMTPLLEAQGVPRDTVYLAMIESGFSPQAYSWARAAGPWQFISATGKHYGLKQDFWVDERLDFVKSTLAAGRYLKHLREGLGHWYLAWAGYNAGGERIRRVIQKKGTRNFWEISDGHGLAKETRHYVPKLIAAALVAKHPKAFGFAPDEFDYEPAATFDEVKLADPTDLEVVATAAGVPLDDVRGLNPELKRWCTPPASAALPYVLRIPSGTLARFTTNFANIAPRERLTFKVHRIRRGDTLSQLGRAYHTPPEAILQLNKLRDGRLLKVNTDLVIPVQPGLNTPADDSGMVAALEKRATPPGTSGRKRVTYNVKAGDSLWNLSLRFHCTVEELQRWNHLSRKGKGLKAGAALVAWAGPGTSVPLENRGGTLVAARKPRSTLARHSLAAGETLWSVAQAYGVTVDELKRWNHIPNERSVRLGQELKVTPP